MKRYVLVVSLLPLMALAGVVDTTWLRQFYRSASEGKYNSASDIHITASGYVYVCGRGQYQLNEWDNGMLLVKYNEWGDTIWRRGYEGDAWSQRDIAHAVAEDASGNVYIAGAIDNNSTGLDATWIKYNSAGNQQWVRSLSLSEDDVLFDVVVNSSGMVFACGVRPHPTLSLSAFFVMRVNPNNGNTVWTRYYVLDSFAFAKQEFTKGRFDGTDQHPDFFENYDDWENCATSMAVSPDGNIVVTGFGLHSEFELEMWTMKFATNGDTLWTRARHNENTDYHDDDVAFDVAVANDNQVYICGFDYLDDTLPVASEAYNYAVARYSSTGAFQNAVSLNTFGVDDDDFAHAIALDNATPQNVYVTGGMDCGIVGYQIVTHKLSSTLGLLWGTSGSIIGSPVSDDFGYDICHKNGRVYVTGARGTELLTIGYTDASASPKDTLWTFLYDGPTHVRDVGSAVAALDSNHVYAAGQSNRPPPTSFPWSSMPLMRYFYSDRDIRADAILAPGAGAAPFDTVTPRIRVVNEGNDIARRFKTFMRIGAGYRDSMLFQLPESLRLMPGDSIEVVFRDWYAPGSGIIPVKCSVAMLGDVYFPNDTLGMTVTISTHDVGATRIIAPTGTIDSTANIAPACSTFNYGPTPETYWVRCKIGSFYNQTAQVTNHASGTRYYVQFPAYTNWPRGTHAVSCSTELTGDADNSNDKVSGQVVVRVRDVGCTKIVIPPSIVDSGVVYAPTCSVYNYGTTTENYPVRFQIGTGYDTTVQVAAHAPGTYQYLVFPNWTAVQRGVHAVACSTRLNGDMNNPNDKATSTVEVRVVDIACTKLVAPTGVVDSGTLVTPVCSTFNYGTTIQSYQMRMRVGTFYDQTVNELNHAPNSYRHIIFPDWNAIQRGTHAVSCSVRLSSDMNHSNDKQTGSVTVRVGDVACTRLVAPSGTVDSGTFVVPACTVFNYGSSIETYDVRLRIGSFYNTVATVNSHVPGTYRYVTFTAWTANQRGSHVVRCSTELDGDINTANDRQLGSVTVRVRDVGALTIVRPSGFYSVGTVITPEAVWRNHGTEPASFEAWMLLSDPTDGRVYSQKVDVVGLAAGLDTTIGSFPNYTLSPSGAWNARCSSFMTGDLNPANNYLDQGFAVGGNPDIGVDAILAPTGNIDTNQAVTPSARVRNYGDVGLGFRAWFAISDPGNSEIYREYVDVATLAVGAESTLSFVQWPGSTIEGQYTTMCSLALVDNNPANNVRRGQFTLGSRPPWPYGWHEVNSIPLPPSNNTRVLKRGAWLDMNEGDGLIYAAKGSKTPDFYDYSALGDTWTIRASIPDGREGVPPEKGCRGAADDENYVYMTKGKNSVGFWRYDIDQDSWNQMPDVLLGKSGKKVKNGADVVHVDRLGASHVYLLKGYRTDFMRFDISANQWEELADAPTGSRGKWDEGSWIVYDGDRTLYAHKAKYHELWLYDLDSLTWSQGSKSPMPYFGMMGRRKKSKDGGSAAWYDGEIYALKGGNTCEFWKYIAATDSWQEVDTMPQVGSTGKKKRVKYGGDITGFGGGVFFAFKGNRTREFWRYVAGPAVDFESPLRAGVAAQGPALPPGFVFQVVPSVASGFRRLSYSLASPTALRLRVSDAAGRVVTTAVARPRAGSGELELDFRRLGAGVYLMRVETPAGVFVRKFVVY